MLTEIKLAWRAFKIHVDRKHQSLMKKPMKSWSPSLTQRTREAVSDISVSPLDGKLHLKNLNGSYATISAENLLISNMELIIKGDAQVVRFENIDELLLAGWAID